MKIAYRIMACKERKAMVDAEVEKLQGCDVKVFYDDRPDDVRKGTFYTQMKCINDVLDGDYTHLCLLQDDILLVNNFDECIKKLIAHKPFALWTLFCSSNKLKVDFQNPYIELRPANTWGQGNLIPIPMLKQIVQFRNERLPNYLYDDGLYLMYLCETGQSCYTTNIALMQHLCPVNSTLGYNNKNKVSKVWAGEDIYEKVNWRSMNIKRLSIPSSCNFEKEYAKYGPN